MFQDWHGLDLWIPKKHREQFDLMKSLDESHHFRKVATFDHLGNRVPVLVVYTTGYAPRETFQGAELLLADFESIGKFYSMAYVYGEGKGFIKRVYNNSPRFMVASELPKETIEHFNKIKE